MGTLLVLSEFGTAFNLPWPFTDSIFLDDIWPLALRYVPARLWEISTIDGRNIKVCFLLRLWVGFPALSWSLMVEEASQGWHDTIRPWAFSSRWQSIPDQEFLHLYQLGQVNLIGRSSFFFGFLSLLRTNWTLLSSLQKLPYPDQSRWRKTVVGDYNNLLD